MSIALSAQIVPSRLLQLAYCLMAAVLFITSLVLLRTAGINHFLFSEMRYLVPFAPSRHSRWLPPLFDGKQPCALT